MLRYNGKGFLPDIPARDLTDEEVKTLGGEEYLLASGLFEKDEPVKPKAKKTKTESETWQE